MRITLRISGKEPRDIEVEEGISGTELARRFGALPPVTLMRLNGKFTPLPERLKDGDDVELILTSSSG